MTSHVSIKASNEASPMTINPLSEEAAAVSFDALDVRGQDGLLAPKVAALGKALARASQLQARMQFGFSQTEWQVVMLLADFNPSPYASWPTWPWSMRRRSADPLGPWPGKDWSKEGPRHGIAGGLT